MRFDGEWFPCDDGVPRPVIRGQVQSADGSWLQTLFLVDTGADRTLLSAAVLQLSGHIAITAARIAGVGGTAGVVEIDTDLRVTRDGGSQVSFRGRYAALTDLEALDMSVLGRDITGLFTVIADQPGDRLCLLHPPHRYTVTAG